MSANDPEIPDSCPKCGANRLPSDYSAAFACGTLVSSKGNYHHTITCHHFSEFRKPLDAERDALAARVKELEAALTEANEQRARFGAQMVRVQERCLKLEAYAGRLATAGDVVSAHAPDDAYLRWFAAKETKP